MNLLLLGAGFSRNWGGWLASEVFEWLIGHPAVTTNTEARALLWRGQKSGGGFEEALSEIQHSHASNSGAHQATLDAMQSAIRDMFDEMNKALHLQQFEFSQDRQWHIATFLGKFDAIYTLNQDTLLEHLYCNGNVPLNNPGKWDGVSLPGLVRGAVTDSAFATSWAYCDWSPISTGEISFPERYQPIYKLHGSSNWRNATGAPLLVMGGSKSKAISDTPLLQSYMNRFREHLQTNGAKLMVIGYGFRDDHINELIIDGAKNGLRLFNISPQGADAAKASNLGRRGSIQPANNDLENVFESNLFGASRRPLATLFSTDMVEHRKVMRFFE